VTYDDGWASLFLAAKTSSGCRSLFLPHGDYVWSGTKCEQSMRYVWCVGRVSSAGCALVTMIRIQLKHESKDLLLVWVWHRDRVVPL
jgi:hypothetical protein